MKREGSGDEEWVCVIFLIKSTDLGIKADGEGVDRSPKTKLKKWP